ncbi:MAG: DUF255 domain-containing protein [Ramlibacter sp.]
MKLHRAWIFCVFALLAPWAVQAAGTASPTSTANVAAHRQKPLVAWQDWSDDAFKQAKSGKRYVLLHLGAVWCHWCHVQEATTYRDPKVLAKIRKQFVPVYVDQDSRPDLSRRYEAYGWPATIVFDADGNDIGKIRGYKEPARFIEILDAILKDPSPVFVAEDEEKDRKFTAAARLGDTARAEVERRYRASLDTQGGGLKQFQRFLPRDTIEYSLALSARGDTVAQQWVKLTLTQARALIDPAWGGVYQYSTHSDWKHPHYEKIMETQAIAMRSYAHGYKAFGDAAYLQSAQSVRRYVARFLTAPDGTFYTSQDADRVPGEQGDAFFALGDAERVKRGIPRVDTHVYSRENGWMIEALAELFMASGERAVLDDALRAANRIVAIRGNPDGSFRHDTKDKGGPFFGDNLAMGRAMLALYAATADRQWLERARQVRAVFPRFAAVNGGGYWPTPARSMGRLAPRANIDENMDAVRFANLLWRYTGDAKDRAAADVALRYIADEQVALRFGQIPGILLASEEASGEPLHITVVGPRADARSQRLMQAAHQQPGIYRRVELWDPSEGKLVNPDVAYPQLEKPAAFLCTNKTCSSPLFEAADIPRHIALVRQLAAEKR